MASPPDGAPLEPATVELMRPGSPRDSAIVATPAYSVLPASPVVGCLHVCGSRPPTLRLHPGASDAVPGRWVHRPGLGRHESRCPHPGHRAAEVGSPR